VLLNQKPGRKTAQQTTMRQDKSHDWTSARAGFARVD
jgi:hypothetical protein